MTLDPQEAALIFVRAKCGSALLISRLALYIASVIWSVIVLVEQGATAPARYVLPPNEDYWAAGVCGVASIRLVLMLVQARSGSAIYQMGWCSASLHAVLLSFWLYVFMAQFAGTVWPAVTAATAVVSALGVYGLIGDMVASLWKNYAPCNHVTPANH